MILLPILVLLSGAILSVSIHHLHQSFFSYYDFVALTMVLGGTVIVGIVLLPWEYRAEVKRAFSFLFRRETSKHHVAAALSMQTIQTGSYSGDTTWLYQRILKEGTELIQLGIPHDRIEAILTERVFQSSKRWKKISSAIRSLAKYPPAFGLMGTVLGLVNIMKGLAKATDAAGLGVEMSVALVATMYGLLVANFVVNPIGELLNKKAEEEEEYAEIALQGILLLSSKSSHLESQEILNAMIPDQNRLELSSLSTALDEAV